MTDEIVTKAPRYTMVPSQRDVRYIDAARKMMADRALPLRLLMGIERIWKLDPSRRVHVSGRSGSTRIRCDGWIGMGSVVEDEITRILIALRFVPADGVATLLSGAWEWNEDNPNTEETESDRIVRDFSAAVLEEEAVGRFRGRALLYSSQLADEEAARRWGNDGGRGP